VYSSPPYGNLKVDTINCNDSPANWQSKNELLKAPPTQCALKLTQLGFTSSTQVVPPPPSLSIHIASAAVPASRLLLGQTNQLYVTGQCDGTYTGFIVDARGVAIYADVPVNTIDCTERSAAWPSMATGAMVRAALRHG
jgi:hypothetical protein